MDLLLPDSKKTVQIFAGFFEMTVASGYFEMITFAGVHTAKMSDIAFHITDVVNNSLTAGADSIEVELRVHEGNLFFAVTDNGCGMTPEVSSRVTDPFFTTRTTRPVGLGLPLLRQAAEQSGGSVSVTSRIGYGTRVEAHFVLDNIDCPPAGDIPEACTLLISGSPNANIIVMFECGAHSFKTSSREISDVLAGIPAGIPAATSAILELLTSNYTEVFAGTLPD